MYQKPVNIALILPCIIEYSPKCSDFYFYLIIPTKCQKLPGENMGQYFHVNDNVHTYCNFRKNRKINTKVTH